MDISEYILKVLKSQQMIMWSWGFHDPEATPQGLKFLVQGFKFNGIVAVNYNEGDDLFDVEFINEAGEVVGEKNEVFVDMLVRVIDDYVERTADYEQRVKDEYKLQQYDNEG